MTVAYRQVAKANDEQTKPQDTTQVDSAVSARAYDILEQAYADGPATPASWDAALQKFGTSVSSPVLAALVEQLHRANKHDEAVEALNSALRNDLAQPWVYDVLALQMTLAKRPEQEIQRVMLSRVDFAASNDPQLLITAAMLSRLEAREAAIKVCREAAARSPSSPEVWKLAGRIAESSGDPRSVVWASTGALENVWADDYEATHEKAVADAEAAILRLEDAGNQELAYELQKELDEARRRDVRVVVRWSGTADLDLEVTEPNGDVCSRKRMLLPSGGRLLGDESGSRSGTVEETYICPRGQSGRYQVHVRYGFGRLVGGRVRVEVTTHENGPGENTIRKSIVVNRDGGTLTFELNRGRGVK